MSSNEDGRQPRELLTVEAAADRLAVSRTTMFALIKNGSVNSVRIGKLRRVPATALAEYVERMI
jgi:excisionase family DNA binding protein